MCTYSISPDLKQLRIKLRQSRGVFGYSMISGGTITSQFYIWMAVAFSMGLSALHSSKYSFWIPLLQNKCCSEGKGGYQLAGWQWAFAFEQLVRNPYYKSPGMLFMWKGEAFKWFQLVKPSAFQKKVKSLITMCTWSWNAFRRTFFISSGSYREEDCKQIYQMINMMSLLSKRQRAHTKWAYSNPTNRFRTSPETNVEANSSSFLCFCGFAAADNFYWAELWKNTTG